MAKRKGDEGPDVTEKEPQQDLIDVDHPQDKPLISSARKIRRLDKERGEIQDKADAEREKLRDLMHDRKITHYKFGDVEITLKPTEKVSVKLAERADGGTSDEGDE